MTSGLTRLPLAGPRLEKLITSIALLAPLAPTPQPSVQAPDSSLASRLFSDAPTVITFFAVPGVPTEDAAEPSLPAAKTKISGWLPAALPASRVAMSYERVSLS